MDQPEAPSVAPPPRPMEAGPVPPPAVEFGPRQAFILPGIAAHVTYNLVIVSVTVGF